MNDTWTKMQKRIFRRMREQGATYAEISKRLGKNYSTVQQYGKRVERAEMLGMIRKKDSICWHCGLATGAPAEETGEPCPWAHGLKPVPGWDAEAVRITCYSSTGTSPGMTWRVDGCPLFREG